jgi:uncharacterized membrane protein YgcG
MIAYDPITLDNLSIRQEATKAFDQGLLSKEEKAMIDQQYPVNFYSHNVFMRTGTFILTLITIFFSLGFFSLTFIDNLSETGVAITGVIYAAVTYAALEYTISKKKHYHSGVDDALIWVASLSLFFSICVLINDSNAYLSFSIISFMIAAYVMVRFANRLMAIVAYASLLAICFFGCTHLGGFIKALVPFVLMIVSAITYVVIKKKSSDPALRYYTLCFQLITIAALLTFYIAGNYFVVRELSNSMFDLNLKPGQTIPFGWLFWIFTIGIPPAYLYFGIKNKDVVLIRVALLLFIAVCFTIRNYYSIAPIEITMTVAGIVLLLIAYGLIKFLKEPKYGFTADEIKTDNPLAALQIESLIITETFSGQQASPDTKFGGGSFGGGGATGDY